MIVVETCPECGHELVTLCLASYPPQEYKECINCGWKSKTRKEKIVYQPCKAEC